jgi:hypothetical protein
MGRVYAVWREVRYEGKTLLGLYKDQQDAIRFAKAYMEEDYRDWEPDAAYPWWYGPDENIFVMDELVK